MIQNKAMQEQRYFDLYADSGGFSKAVSNLVLKAGFPSKFKLMPLEGGRNNKVFCIEHGNIKALLKAYFQHPEDKRERLKAEYSFLNFAHSNKISCLPKPIAADLQNNLGLYQFIEGRKLGISEVDQEKISSALNFFIDVNKYKNTSEAKSLPIASDACFSIKEHIAHVEKRLERLKEIKNDSEANKNAIIFIKNKLLPELNKAMKNVNKFIDDFKIKANEKIPNDAACISPSDFGYHNTLLDKSNNLIFIDFEYAGWDDPAKMVCDFFSQPEVSVSLNYYDYFIRKVADNIANPEEFKKRVTALLPLYKVKWCCILLNDFLEPDAERRNFAYGNAGLNTLNKQKAEQLEKAGRYLESISFI